MSILRSSKFFKQFVNITRSILITQPRGIDETLLLRCKVLTGSRSGFSSSSILNMAVNPIEKSIQKLDQDVRRTGRISKRELDEVLEEIEQSHAATSTQSLMIIRCCGNLFPEEVPEVRTQLVKKIWSTFENLGVPFDISHHNALLRVYVENEHKFSSSEFLSDLLKKGIEPNRVTYQGLIAACCQRGDIKEATRILEAMREKELPVNESVFNSLITGHSQTGDMESAQGILSVMSQANIAPSADTYTALLCGYAKHGDIEAIEKVLSQCQDKDIDLLDRDLLEVIFTLAVNKHYQLMEQLFSKLKKLPGFNQDAKNVILRLIARGEDQAAFKVLQVMSPITVDGEPIAYGNFLIRQLVNSNRPIDTVISICNELKSTGVNQNGLLVATEASLVRGTNQGRSLMLLSALAEEHEVCFHYYWPVLIQFGQAGNEKGIMETLRQMSKDMNQTVTGETLRDYVIPYLSQSIEGVHSLRHGGISLASAAAAMVAHFIVNKRELKPAADIALKVNANYNFPQVRRGIVSAFIDKHDVDSLGILVRVLNKGETSEDVQSILLDITRRLRENRTELVTALLEKYFEMGIGLSNEKAETLQNMLSGDELTQEISSLLAKLTSPDLVPATLERPFIHTSRRQFQQSESSLLETIKELEAKGESTLEAKRALLECFCYHKDLEKADQLVKELENGGLEFTNAEIISLVDLYVQGEKLNEAMEWANKITATEIDPFQASSLLRLGTLMIKNGKVQETIDLFTRHKLNEEMSKSRVFMYSSLCWRILNTLAETKDVDNLKKLFTVLLDNKFIEPTNVNLGSLIKVHLLRGELAEALTEFEECCTRFRSTPWKNELSCQLIQTEDSVGLQKVTDLSTQVHGEFNSLYDLVLSFVECGRIRQARKILEIPVLRTKSYQRLNSASERYSSDGKVEHLENLVEATKDLTHIDRSELYYHLLVLYSNSEEVDKAFGLWTQMQDEDVQPSDQFLLTLSTLLRKHNRDIPFAVPKAGFTEKGKEKKPVQVGPGTRALRRALYSRNVDEVLAVYSQINSEDLSKSDRGRLISFLLDNGRLGDVSKTLIQFAESGNLPHNRALSRVVNDLAKAGQVETLDTLSQLFNDDIKRYTSFSNRHVHSFVVTGRAPEVLIRLEEQLKAADTEEKLAKFVKEFPRGGIFSVLQSSPELLSKFETLARIMLEKGIHDGLNIVWMQHTLNGKLEKAAEIWPLIKSSERLMFMPILRSARATEDIQMVDHLLESCKSALTPRSIGLMYSTALDILLKQEKLDECEERLEAAVKACSIEEMNRSTLIKLKNTLIASGKEFKYTIPEKYEGGDNSTSSDSDSDTDTARKASAR